MPVRRLATGLLCVRLWVAAGVGAQGPSTADLPRARELCETGQYAECAALAASVTDPGLAAAAATLRGEAYEAQGRLDEAQALYQRVARRPEAERARVLLGRLLLARGREPQARPLFSSLVRAYRQGALRSPRPEALAYVAMASRALGAMHDANDTFRLAALADRSRAETQLEWAELFLSKRDHEHAAQSVLEALSHDRGSPRAHTLMARIALARSHDAAEARAAAERALAKNPRYVPAHVVLASIALRDMELSAADEHLDRALATNPSDLSALSVRAAVRFLADDQAGFARAKQEVFARNPRYSELYGVIAQFAHWEHRYPELVALGRAALAVNPHDAAAHALLGQSLLRMGEEDEGLRELRLAWAGDHFNVEVFHTLHLYEQVISREYVQLEAAPFRIRLHARERAALQPYLVPLLQEAYASLVQRYGFTPEGPLSVELYAKQEHFSVRTTGLPNVGVQGVCFGKVVTGLSPRGGHYNYGQIVWHELSHVFHLQLSRNRVPRWLTEGLAEYETTLARAHFRREDDLLLWRAVRAGRLPALGALNQAFTQAQRPEELMAAYHAASLAVDYIVRRFGWDKIRPLLERYAAGARSEAAVREVLGVTLSELDHGFRAELARRLARFDAEFQVDFGAYDDVTVREAAAARAPRDPGAQAALAAAKLVRRDFDAALAAGRAALALEPKQPLAHFVLARVALERGDVRWAERCLLGLVEAGHDAYVIRLMLARAALARAAPADARRHLAAARQIDPDRPEAFRAQLELAERVRDAALALDAVRALAALDQHDRVTHAAFVALLAKARRWQELARAAEDAMYLDPENGELHAALGQAYLELGRARDAVVELDRALAQGSAEPVAVRRLRERALAAAAGAAP